MSTAELPSREMDRLTDPQVEEYIESADSPTALVPVGALEQHGPHLCVGTDIFIPSEICRRIADDVDALVAPSINYGFSDDHTGFSGVAYLNQETLIDVISDVGYSLCEAGFDDVVFVNGHYTNEAPLKVGCNEVMRKLPENKYVYGFPYWDTLGLEDLGSYLSFEVGLHANIGETSAVMAIDEDLVDLDEAVEEHPNIPMDVPNPYAMMNPIFFGPSTIYRTTESGTWGDPSDSSAERGEEYYDTITDAVAAVIKTFREERSDIYIRPRPTSEELLDS